MKRSSRTVLPVVVGVMAMSLSACQARAAYQTCGERFIGSDVVRCPDGSVPRYNPGAPPVSGGAVTSQPGNGARLGVAAQDAVYGIWHTTRPGISYPSAIDVPGAYLLVARAGLAAGDLTISPNGTYVWNSYTGTSGRWIKGDDVSPVVLIDDTHHMRWKVGLAGGVLLIGGGGQVYSGRR